LLSTLSYQSFLSRIVQYLSLINFVLLQTDGEHQEHQHQFWPARAEQPEYRPADADAMPPPLSPEQFFQLQMQMMATLNNTIQTL
jgi:hypothetical protein